MLAQRLETLLLCLLRLLAALCTLLAWVVLMAWLLGRVVSDRWLWSQFLFWLPTLAAIVSACVLTIVAAILRGVAPPRNRRRSSTARLCTIALLLALLGVTTYFTLIECRVLASSPSETTPRQARVVFWNPSSWVRQGTVEALMPFAPDIAIVANAPAGVRWRRLIEADHAERTVVFVGRFHVVSCWPVIRRGGTTLGLSGRVPHPRRHKPDMPRYSNDPGWAVFMEFDTPHGPLVVWTIDLPSDITMSRRNIASKARAAIDAWRDGDGRGFPPPDLIVGDFNMTRGSFAMQTLVGDLKDAYAQAGRGYTATWPRIGPILHIDHAFTAAPWRAIGYSVANPGTGNHRMLVLDLVREQARP